MHALTTWTVNGNRGIIIISSVIQALWFGFSWWTEPNLKYKGNKDISQNCLRTCRDGYQGIPLELVERKWCLWGRLCWSFANERHSSSGSNSINKWTPASNSCSKIRKQSSSWHQRQWLVWKASDIRIYARKEHSLDSGRYSLLSPTFPSNRSTEDYSGQLQSQPSSPLSRFHEQAINDALQFGFSILQWLAWSSSSISRVFWY